MREPDGSTIHQLVVQNVEEWIDAPPTETLIRKAKSISLKQFAELFEEFFDYNGMIYLYGIAYSGLFRLAYERRKDETRNPAFRLREAAEKRVREHGKTGMPIKWDFYQKQMEKVADWYYDRLASFDNDDLATAFLNRVYAVSDMGRD